MLGLSLVGCASKQTHEEVLYEPRAATNLALGPTPYHNRLGEALAQRSDWPSTYGGYLFDNVTFQANFIFDDQSFFDGQGGWYQNMSTSAQTGVLIR